ncbi:hypothetical protein [Planktothrix paucivesiculata]|uniref:Uncharacterized protein n=1 Tax=Planktothrix paucivesiculata PCC 9631 TaxID=671071 RepID=A0A7Z9BIS5_9CYAN|nr:hypothetical protein [Planktothrix paucivesiculata]VXD12798.1 hypothetical protein PL9631_1060203 [Planktothrix paucivesiculata PCC 9631]
MSITNHLSLVDAKPTDIPHLLLWDTPNDLEINQLLFNNNAQKISYRDNLLSRINNKHKFLILHENLGQELEAIKQICESATKPVILLTDLDILITYLYTQPDAPISLFWQKLEYMRHLQSILWILLPSKLSPPNWNKRHLQSVVSHRPN